jgi:hypothetical protein
MTMYKIYGDNQNRIIKGNKCFSNASTNRDYQRFIQDVAEQGMSIVEGPDVVEPSYSDLRIYPSIQDQLDMQFHDQVNGTTTWKDTIQEIKERHPKTITGGTTVGEVPAWVQEAVNEYRSRVGIASTT